MKPKDAIGVPYRIVCKKWDIYHSIQFHQRFRLMYSLPDTNGSMPLNFRRRSKNLEFRPSKKPPPSRT